MNLDKILIIGGSGFLGRTIIDLFLEKRIPFTYSDINPIDGMEENFLYLNILEANDFKKLDKDFSAVINLTGQISIPINNCFQLNTRGIDNIINYVKSNDIYLIQVSTISVYGSSKSLVDEDSLLNPETSYGSLKAAAEYLIQSKLPKDKVTILRLSNLYGDRQPKGVIAYLMRSLNQNENIFFNNDGSLRRYFLNVEDAANLITKLSMSFKSGTYNFLGNDFYSIRELIDLIEQITAKKLDVCYNGNKPWENLDNIDSSKFESMFGYKYKHSLREWITKSLL